MYLLSRSVLFRRRQYSRTSVSEKKKSDLELFPVPQYPQGVLNTWKTCYALLRALSNGSPLCGVRLLGTHPNRLAWRVLASWSNLGHRLSYLNQDVRSSRPLGPISTGVGETPALLRTPAIFADATGELESVRESHYACHGYLVLSVTYLLAYCSRSSHTATRLVWRCDVVCLAPTRKRTHCLLVSTRLIRFRMT